MAPVDASGVRLSVTLKWRASSLKPDPVFSAVAVDFISDCGALTKNKVIAKTDWPFHPRWSDAFDLIQRKLQP